MEAVSTGVLDTIKEYLRSKDKAKNDMMYQDIYNCICQNTKKNEAFFVPTTLHCPFSYTQYWPFLVRLFIDEHF